MSEFFSFCIDVSLDFTFFSGIETAHFANIPTRGWKKKAWKTEVQQRRKNKKKRHKPTRGIYMNQTEQLCKM